MFSRQSTNIGNEAIVGWIEVNDQFWFAMSMKRNHWLNCVGLPMKTATPHEASPASSAMLKICRAPLSSTHGLVLDAGCGGGRNAFALARRGHNVIAADYDVERIAALLAVKKGIDGASENTLEINGSISCVVCDLLRKDWPFAEKCFDAIVCIHFPVYSIVSNMHRFLSRNGWLYFESVGAQGGNYLQLPKRSWMEQELKGSYKFIHYEERPAGPVGRDAVAVKLLACRM
jgi:SAM-dependent methyltransferase